MCHGFGIVEVMGDFASLTEKGLPYDSSRGFSIGWASEGRSTKYRIVVYPVSEL